jgi:hypothetical protein
VFVLDTPGMLPPAIQDPHAALNIALTGEHHACMYTTCVYVYHLRVCIPHTCILLCKVQNVECVWFTPYGNYSCGLLVLKLRA